MRPTLPPTTFLVKTAVIVGKLATEDVGRLIGAIQGDAGSVVEALKAIGEIIDRINETQTMISGVLTEQAAVTRDIVGKG
jgi:hypothetical protein